METESKHEHHLDEIDMETLFRDEDDQWMDAAARAYEEKIDEDDQWMDDAARAYEEKVAADDLPQPWPKIIDHEEYYGTDGGMPYFMRWAFFSRTEENRSSIAEPSNNPIDDTYDPHNYMKDNHNVIMRNLQYYYPGYRPRYYYDDEVPGTSAFPAFNHCDFSTMPTLSPVYVQNEGYQSLDNIDGTIKVHHDKLDASTMLHLLSLVPDFELCSVRQRNLMSDLLKTVVRKKSTEDNITLEMHHSRVGRLWLYVPFTSFYRNLFDDLLNLRHARLIPNESAEEEENLVAVRFILNESLSSEEKLAAVRIYATVSTIMILLARFSCDFEQPDFYAYVVNGFMMNAFENAMDKDQFALATIFSLFVPRDVVVRKCHDAYEKYRELIDMINQRGFFTFAPGIAEKLMNASALKFMSFVRGHQLIYVDYETTLFEYSFQDEWDNWEIENFFSDLFEQSLGTRALGKLLNYGGIVEAFRLMANVDLPWSSNNLIVHRYFYGLVWRFLNNSISAEKLWD